MSFPWCSHTHRICNVFRIILPPKRFKCLALIQSLLVSVKPQRFLYFLFLPLYLALDPVEIIFPDDQEFMDSEISNSYRYTFKLLEGTAANDVRQLAAKAAEILDVKDYARFDFRVRDGIPYLFDIAGTPYTIRHSSIAYLFDQ